MEFAWVLISVQLAWARQDVKERESSDEGVAGRMTATARADIETHGSAPTWRDGLALSEARVPRPLDSREEHCVTSRLSRGVQSRWVNETSYKARWKC